MLRTINHFKTFPFTVISRALFHKFEEKPKPAVLSMHLSIFLSCCPACQPYTHSLPYSSNDCDRRWRENHDYIYSSNPYFVNAIHTWKIEHEMWNYRHFEMAKCNANSSLYLWRCFQAIAVSDVYQKTNNICTIRCVFLCGNINVNANILNTRSR